MRRLAIVVSAIAFCLAIWQLRRDGERNAGREAALKVADLPALGDADPIGPESAWRRVDWTGHFDGTVELMAGRQHGDERGYGLLEGFTRSDGQRFLVDRGWLAADSADDAPRPTDAARLHGQLRPLTPREATPIAGHGTRIWPYGAHAAAVPAGASRALYVVEGALDGSPEPGAPGVGGFDRVPPRDDTSLHYAGQWLAIALLAGAASKPGIWRSIGRSTEGQKTVAGGTKGA